MNLRFLFILCLLLGSLTISFSETQPFNKNSRYLISGFHIPEQKILLKELPVIYDHQYILSFKQKDKLWLLLFIDPLHPLFSTYVDSFQTFTQQFSPEQLEGIILSREEINGNYDPRGRTARLLGIDQFPSLVILKDTGEIIARMKGRLPDWESEDLKLAIEETE